MATLITNVAPELSIGAERDSVLLADDRRPDSVQLGGWCSSRWHDELRDGFLAKSGIEALLRNQAQGADLSVALKAAELFATLGDPTEVICLLHDLSRYEEPFDRSRFAQLLCYPVLHAVPVEMLSHYERCLRMDYGMRPFMSALDNVVASDWHGGAPVLERIVKTREVWRRYDRQQRSLIRRAANMVTGTGIAMKSTWEEAVDHIGHRLADLHRARYTRQGHVIAEDRNEVIVCFDLTGLRHDMLYVARVMKLETGWMVATVRRYAIT